MARTPPSFPTAILKSGSQAKILTEEFGRFPFFDGCSIQGIWWNMIIEKTKILGLTLVKPDIFEDHRGTFVETYNADGYLQNDIGIEFVRDAISTSSKYVLRGIHYDNKTWKLIQCLYGKIYFVVIELHEGSPNFLKWESFILSGNNRHQVLVPPGFGNGHLVLSEECIFHYKMSEYYDGPNEKVFKWDDPKAAIFWPIHDPIMSSKDAIGYNPQNKRE